MRSRLRKNIETGLEIAGLTSIALFAGCDSGTVGDSNVDPVDNNSGYEDVWEGDDAYVPVDDFVAPDNYLSGNDTTQGGEDTEQGNDNYEGNLAPVARACRDNYRNGDGSCKPLELEAGKFYVFNFSDVPDSQYANSINASAGENPIPGHPTKSEDLDGEIKEYCVQWNGSGWACHEGKGNFLHHFEAGSKGVIRVGVVDDQGESSEIDSIDYVVK